MAYNAHLTAIILSTFCLSGFTGLAIGYVMGRDLKNMRRGVKE